MKKLTKQEKVWSVTVILIIMAIAIVAIHTCIDAVIEKMNTKTANTGIQIAEAKSQEKLYKDDGSGMMIIHKCYNSSLLKNGYSQWKNDYPEREQRIVAAAFKGVSQPSLYFVLIYKTE